MLSIKTLFENSQPRLNLVNVTKYKFKINLEEVKFFDKTASGIFLDNKTTQSLVLAREMLPPKYNFLVNSGHRGYDIQVKINRYMKTKLQKSNPNNWEDMLNTFTGGEQYLEYLRNNKTFSHMSHASGKAVDIGGIFNEKNKLIDMGGQTTTVTDQLNYYENKTSPKDIVIRDNRRMLKTVMTKNNFEGYKDEWWHWGYYK